MCIRVVLVDGSFSGWAGEEIYKLWIVYRLEDKFFSADYVNSFEKYNILI